VSSEKSRLSTAGDDDSGAIRQVHPPVSAQEQIIVAGSWSARRTTIGHFRLVSQSFIFRSGIAVAPNQLRVAGRWRASRIRSRPFGRRASPRLATIDVVSTFCLAAVGSRCLGRRRRLAGGRERASLVGTAALGGVAAALDTAHPTHRYRSHRVAYLRLPSVSPSVASCHSIAAAAAAAASVDGPLQR